MVLPDGLSRMDNALSHFCWINAFPIRGSEVGMAELEGKVAATTSVT